MTGNSLYTLDPEKEEAAAAAGEALTLISVPVEKARATTLNATTK